MAAMESFQPPPLVTNTCREYTPSEGYEVVPKNRKVERSFIFDWGVRVRRASDCSLGWVCLGSEECRAESEIIPLYGGRTSTAAKHLSDAHSVMSKKTSAEMEKKRAQTEGTLAQLSTTASMRLTLLLETLRMILSGTPLRFADLEVTQKLFAISTKRSFAPC